MWYATFPIYPVEHFDPMSQKCNGTNKAGRPCGNWAIKGGTVCPNHGGKAPQVKSKALVRAELANWRLGDATVDPGEVLLRLVSQSSARADFYASLLQEAYEAAERLAYQEDEPQVEDGGRATESRKSAQEDLHRIFNHGGVAALIGNTYGAVKDVGVYETGEAIRGLAKLEAEERERCATFATKAVAAGLAERQVRLAERQGEMLASLVRAVIDAPELELTEGQKQVARSVFGREMRALTAA